MPNPAILKGRIYQVIFEHGPMTYAKLATYLTDVSEERIKGCINEDRRKRIAKTFRVEDWHRNLEVRGRASPVIAIGKGEDAPLPDFADRLLEANQRYNKKRTKQTKQEVETTVSLVFANMFAPTAPIELKGVTARTHRLSNKEPKQNGKTTRHVPEDPQTPGRKRAAVNARAV